MSAAHSPAPWSYSASKSGAFRVGAPGKCIAYTPVCYPRGKMTLNEANAKLIAVAPEMADLLTQMLDPLVDTVSWTAKTEDLLRRAGVRS